MSYLEDNRFTQTAKNLKAKIVQVVEAGGCPPKIWVPLPLGRVVLGKGLPSWDHISQLPEAKRKWAEVMYGHFQTRPMKTS